MSVGIYMYISSVISCNNYPRFRMNMQSALYIPRVSILSSSGQTGDMNKINVTSKNSHTFPIFIY